MSKQKDDKNVDRLVRFRNSSNGNNSTTLPATQPQTIQELIMVPLFFSFPEGGSVD